MMFYVIYTEESYTVEYILVESSRVNYITLDSEVQNYLAFESNYMYITMESNSLDELLDILSKDEDFILNNTPYKLVTMNDLAHYTGFVYSKEDCTFNSTLTSYDVKSEEDSLLEFDRDRMTICLPLMVGSAVLRRYMTYFMLPYSSYNLSKSEFNNIMAELVKSVNKQFTEDFNCDHQKYMKYLAQNLKEVT